MGSDPRDPRLASPPPLPASPPIGAAPPVLGYADETSLLDSRLHPWTMVVSLIRAVQSLLPIVVVAVFLRAAGRSSDWIELFVAALGTLRVVGAMIVWRTYRFWIDGQSLHIRSGLIFRSQRAIPLDRIQNINLKRDWIHQLLGLAEVQVETASGTGAEATVSSLSLPQAELLRRQLLGQRTEPSVAEKSEDRDSQVVYHAGVGRLILAGATRNQAGAVIAAIVGFGFWLWELSGRDFDQSQLWRWIGVIPQVTAKWLMLAIGVAGLFFIGWIVSMVRSVLTYYGFTLWRQAGRLRRSYGLFTRRESVFPAHRLQVMRIEAPLVQRKVGYCRILAETAGSFAEKEQASTSELCPIIEHRRSGEIAGMVIEGLDLASVQWRKVSRKFIRRATVRYLLLLAAVVGLATLNTRYGLWLACAAPLTVWAAVLQYRALRWSLTDRLMIVRRGAWTRVFEIVPREKVQHSMLSSSPFQRRMGLATLRIRTAGGGGSGVRIADLPIETAHALQDEMTGRPVTIPAPTGELLPKTESPASHAIE